MDIRQLAEAIRKNREQLPEDGVRGVDRKAVTSLIEDIRSLFYPQFFGRAGVSDEELLAKISDGLTAELSALMPGEEAGHCVNGFISSLPDIQEKLSKDAQAIFEGDPSAKSVAEVIITYPGFAAILAYRAAHVLYRLGVPVIPRIFTEYAHEKTGIDINPGAEIGEYFCIDHGTGIVIGETAVVGDHVRMYQGVTLGVRQFLREPGGALKKNYKRHPNVGDNVILYANATVLGGETYIEDGSVIPSGSLIRKTPEAK